MKSLRIARRAQRDFDDILEDSQVRFGAAVARRYARLLVKALRDLRVDPMRIGVQTRRELPEGLRLYHIRHSRGRGGEREIGRPRHFLVFRDVDEGLLVLRVLHDAMDLPEHL